jgi:hypothetical protein
MKTQFEGLKKGNSNHNGPTLANTSKPEPNFSTLQVAARNAAHLLCSIAKLPSLELKTLSKQLLGYLPLDMEHLLKGEGTVQLNFLNLIVKMSSF